MFFKLKCGVRAVNDGGHSGRPHKSKVFRKKTQNMNFGPDNQSQNIGNLVVFCNTDDILLHKFIPQGHDTNQYFSSGD